MKRTLASTLAATVLVTLTASATAFAGGIGRAGTYGPQDTTQAATQNTAQVEQAVSNDNSAPKTRAEVRAELVEAYRNGTLPSLNKTTYPDLSLIGRTQAQRIALQEERANDTTRVARAGE